MPTWPLFALAALVLFRCAAWPPSSAWQRSSPAADDDDRPWVSVTDLGRLGNQMSEYASLLALAKDFNWRPYISTRKHSSLSVLFPALSVATASPASASGSDDDDVGVITANSLERGDRIPVKRKYFLANVPKLLDRIVRYRKDILKEFTLSKSITTHVHRFLSPLNLASSSRRSVLIGLHVRRSDYVYHLKTMLGADIFEPQFYSRAVSKTLTMLNLSPADVHVVVASDEPRWCKENLSLSAFNVSFTSDYYSRLGDPINLAMAFDLGVMSSCDHVLYDYGTFGFWCAFMCVGKGFTPEFYPNSNKTIRLVKEIKSANMVNNKFQFI